MAAMPKMKDAELRHGRTYARRLASLQDEYRDHANQGGVLDRFEADWGNFRLGQERAAARAAVDADDWELAYLYASAADLVGLCRQPSLVRTWIEPALSLPVVTADPGLAAEQMNRLGSSYYDAGRFVEAGDMWRRALDTHRRIPESEDERYRNIQEAGLLSNLGAAEDKLGDIAAARTAYEHARNVFHEAGERLQEGRMWGNLGTLDAEEGHHEPAIDKYDLALSIAQDEHDPAGVELWIGAKGNSLVDLGRLEEGHLAVVTALELARQLGDRAQEGVRLGNVAKALLRLGDLDGAMEHREEALRLARQMEDRRGEALQLLGMGEVHAAREHRDAAAAAVTTAERIFEEIGMRREAGKLRDATARMALRDELQQVITAGRSLIEQERFADAVDVLLPGLSLHAEASPAHRSVLLGLLAFAEHLDGRIDQAAEHYAEALRLDRELPPGELQAHHLANVGDLYRQLGDQERTAACYEAALRVPDVPDAFRERLRYGLGLVEIPSDEPAGSGPPPADALGLALKLANLHAAGSAPRVAVTYRDGVKVTGEYAGGVLGPAEPVVTVALPGGLPLRLVFERIASVEVGR
jgi:tetratricopeptide (TPR) repeat protein